MRNLEIDLKKVITVIAVIIVLVAYTLCFRPVSLLGDNDTAQLVSLTVEKNGTAEDITDQVNAEDVLVVLESGNRARNTSDRPDAAPEDGEVTAVVTDSTGTYTIILKPVTEDASVLYYDDQNTCYTVKQSAYLLSILDTVLPQD